MKNYIGHDGFLWWIGIVEDTADPLKLGRCRVRCFGYHAKRIRTDKPDEQPVPPDHLPWATCLMPSNMQNFYGRPNAGDWVIGFFLDARDAQEPVIMGILPGIPTVVKDYFSMHPRFAKTFTKIKNDESTNRNQLINTLHSLVNSETKQLVTLPDEGLYLSEADLEALQLTLSKSETTSEKTFAFYHENGSLFEITDFSNSQKQPVNRASLKLFNGSNLELRKEVLNEAGDLLDHVVLDHSASGGKLTLETRIVSGIRTDKMNLTSSSASIEMSGTELGTTINISHPSGTSIVIDVEGKISINSVEDISVVSLKTVNISGETINLLSDNVNLSSVSLPGVGDLASKLASMDAEIEVAKTLPVPPTP